MTILVSSDSERRESLWANLKKPVSQSASNPWGVVPGVAPAASTTVQTPPRSLQTV